MSETTLGREPLQIIEITTPKCFNTQGTAPCTAAQTGDGRCFNTRATCTDVDNFQARPLAHLTADLLLLNGDTIPAASIDTANSALIEVDVNFGTSPSGTIFAFGSASNFCYLGVTGTDLVLAVGGNTAADQARAVVPLTTVAARSVRLIAEIDFAGNTATLYEFDPIELLVTQLATDSADTAFPAAWAAATDGIVGEDSGITYGTETGGTYNRSIPLVRVHSNQTATIGTGSEDYRQRYYFDDGRKAKPSDELYILPALIDVQTVGTRLNVAGADERYESLGRRAFLSASFADFAHSDFPFDPYLSDRTYDPLERSSFWAKWLQRNKYGKTRAVVKIYTGYDGEALSAMRSQTYVLDKLDWGRDSVSMEARDYLSLTEFRRVQVPAASSGKVAEALTDVATTLKIVGDVTTEYPATGTLRINDELMTYASRSYVALGNTTDFTITRATDGSTASEHNVDDNVQLCKRYTQAALNDILEEFLIDEAKIPGQVVNLAKIETEVTENLTAYTVSTVISEPTGVDQLVGELSEQCSFYIWWNEREQEIDFQAIRALDTVSVELSQERNIIKDSFELTERPSERLTTISIFYNPRDFAGDLNKPVNFANLLIVSNSSNSDLDQYGKLPQIREIFSRWLRTEAQANQTGSRMSVRFEDVPAYVKFKVDAKDRVYWVGDFMRLSHDQLVNARGERDTTRRWLVIEAEETEAGHEQMLTLIDVTLDGRIYRITANGIGNYTAELFAASNAFITDNNGLNPDGTKGATIS